jgi:hypothetical protein
MIKSHTTDHSALGLLQAVTEAVAQLSASAASVNVGQEACPIQATQQQRHTGAYDTHLTTCWQVCQCCCHVHDRPSIHQGVGQLVGIHQGRNPCSHTQSRTHATATATARHLKTLGHGNTALRHPERLCAGYRGSPLCTKEHVSALLLLDAMQGTSINVGTYGA